MAVKSYDKNKKGGGNKPDFKKKFDKTKQKIWDDNSTTPANKKRALKHERQSHRKHATTVVSAKEIWNELRVKTNDKATNTKLCLELHGLLQGKCMEVAMQHDASRCVQGVLQFGTAEQRREVVVELCSAGEKSKEKDGNNDKKQNVNLGDLCKIQYAHFVVLKMIKYCGRDDLCVKLIVKVRYGLMYRVIRIFRVHCIDVLYLFWSRLQQFSHSLPSCMYQYTITQTDIRVLKNK